MPKRKLANTSFPISSNSLNIHLILFSTQFMDIEINMLRGQSSSLSSNSSRKYLIYSNTLFMAYADRVQALANNPSWAKQIKSAKL